MWKIKNSDEYAVMAETRKQAVIKFKKNLNMNVKLNMLEKVY